QNEQGESGSREAPRGEAPDPGMCHRSSSFCSRIERLRLHRRTPSRSPRLESISAAAVRETQELYGRRALSVSSAHANRAALFHFGSDGIWKVTEAHKLSQSAAASGGAGIMCTALISQAPARPRRNAARPSESERATSLSSSWSLFIATTRAAGRGLPSQ